MPLESQAVAAVGRWFDHVGPSAGVVARGRHGSRDRGNDMAKFIGVSQCSVTASCPPLLIGPAPGITFGRDSAECEDTGTPRRHPRPFVEWED